MGFLNPLPRHPSAMGSMLWSLGVHGVLLVASYSWWSVPIAPASFTGHRYGVQIEASFSEMPIDREIETVLDLKLVPPQEEILPTKLPCLEDELAMAPPPWSLEETSSQGELVNKTSETIPSLALSLHKDFLKTKSVEVPNRPRPQPNRSLAPEAMATTEKLAGNENQEPPDLSSNPPPIYPAEAIRQRLEGVVILRVYIAASGQVERVEIAKSSGHAILDHAATEAVSSWHARPAEQRGRPVATVAKLPIHFQL